MTSPRPRLRFVLATLALSCAVVGLLWVAASGSSFAREYIGADRCGECHPAALEAWKQGPHAKAYDALTGAQRENPRCLQCHSLKTEAKLQHVTCETCHGPGRYYAPEYVMRDPELARALWLLDVTEQTCARCHNESSASITPWDYQQSLERIRHWGEGFGKEAPADEKKAEAGQE